MAVHQKHPSIVALSAKKRVKQFKQLFNNSNNNDNNNNNYKTTKTKNTNLSKHKSNDSILELKKRCLVNGGLNYQSKCDALNADSLDLSDNNNTPRKSKKRKGKNKSKSKSKSNAKSPKTSKGKGKTKGKTKGKGKYKKKSSSKSDIPIAPIGPINTIYGTERILSIIPQPIHCRALPTWLEASDDDEFTQYTDYSDDTDLDDINQQMSMSMSSSDLTVCDSNDDDGDQIEQTLAICATLTLSTSIGDSTPPPNTTTNPLDSTTFVLQQSITSPLKTLNSINNVNNNDCNQNLNIQETQFNFGAAMAEDIMETETEKEKSNMNETKQTNTNMTNTTNINKENTNIVRVAHIHHGPSQSLITLRNRKLVNGGLENDNHGHIEYCDEGDNDDNDDNDEDTDDDEGQLSIANLNINDTESDIQSIGRFTVISPTKRCKSDGVETKKNIIKTKTGTVKEWKPISNATYQKIKQPRESLILLKQKRLVNCAMKNFDFIDEETEDNEDNDDNDTDDNIIGIFESDPEHRSLPTWLANDEEIGQFIIDNGINNNNRQHIKQETDVLD